jgi:signal transduction histidine kinase/CheY-like chemotaxis protein
VSDLTPGAVVKQLVFAVRVPVIRDGDVKYVLTAVVDPAVINRLILGQGIPNDWIGAVLDSKFRFVARTHAPPRAADDYASKSLQDALVTKGEGWVRGTTLEGGEIYRAFNRSAVSGWSTSIAIPSSVVNQGAVRAAWLLVVGVALAVAIAVFLGLLFAKRITRPIDSLVSVAPALGRGDTSVTPPATNVDEVRKLATVLHDASVKILERENRQKAAEQALRTADRAKDEFLAMLGHELRNPLATLTTAAQLLKLAGKQQDIVDNAQALIGRQVQHMAHLVDDLLEVGRVTGGKIKLNKSALNLAAVTDRFIATWRDSGRFAYHQVVTDLKPAWVVADESRIEQILSNLLDNALKFTPFGGQVALRVYRADADAVLEVADTGQGLPPELIHRVFDLFVQGERGLAREQGGLGIGLTMVKRVAELHNGTVRATSEGIGKGATFTVRLPAIDPPAVSNTSATQRKPTQKGRCILIIEDNKDARDTLDAVLKLIGHDVISAENGSEGVRLALQNDPDIALVDIGLPDLDGYQVANQLRQSRIGKHVRLIALTGYGSAEDRRRALAAGFDEHLTKPVDMDRLEQMLGTHAVAKP